MEDLYYLHEAETEPIPGYRLLHPLGRGGFGEVWKCEAPGGLLKAIKFVDGGVPILDANAPADEELRAIQRVKTIRHPFILSMERVESVEGELIIVMELADKSLADVLVAQQEAGKPGIPREALLAYLREAAEVLDVMNSRHGLQHLDIKPRNLFLVSNHVKVGDFGLVSSLSSSTGETPLGAITPLYASPEVFQGSISAHSDQYSLAIVYQELLTGTLPFRGKNSRQLLMQHLQAQPDLSALSDADRDIVARALSKNPIDRFPSCTDFIHALASGQSEVITETTIYLPEPEAPSRAREDTKRTPSAKTVQTRCVRPVTASSGAMKILDLVSRTPLTEVWKGRASDGSPRTVKVAFGCPRPGDAGVTRLGQLRHPALLPIEVVSHAPGRLVLASPSGDRNLRDLLAAEQAQGETGIPRSRLLPLLRAAAEGLVYLHQKYNLQHLGLNPRTMVLDGDRLLLADFAVAQLVWHPAGQSVSQLNGRYSAPEVALGVFGPAADQYSLALTFHELRTGVLPVRKGDGRALDRLPEADRAVIARALHPDPARRWGNAIELVQALEQASDPEEAQARETLIDSRTEPTLTVPAGPRPEEPAVAGRMQTRFGTSLAVDVIRQRVEGFRHQWSANLISSSTREFSFQMLTPRSLWQRCTGKQPGLDIRLTIGQPEMAAPAGVQVRTEVCMDLSPHECTREQSAELLKVVGPLLVESMRTHLRITQQGRMQERIVWHHPLQLCSIQADGRLGPPIECQGKDISLNGIGFYLPGQLPSSQVVLQLPQTPQTPRMQMPARIVRVQGCGDGWYEVGAVLLPPDDLPGDEDGDH